MATEYIEAALKSKISSITTATVGGRVYPSTAPATVTNVPWITYFLKNRTQLGRSTTERGGLARDVFQVDGFSDRNDPTNQGYLDVKEIHRLLMRETGDGGLDGNVGAWTYGTGTASIFVQGCRVEDNEDEFAPPVFAETTGIHAASMNVIVVYNQPEGH